MDSVGGAGVIGIGHFGVPDTYANHFHEHSLFAKNKWSLGYDRIPPSRWIMFPLWLPIVIVAIPTLLVWRFGPKPPKPGHCQCGYNLTGLTEARCPECGEAFNTESS